MIHGTISNEPTADEPYELCADVTLDDSLRAFGWHRCDDGTWRRATSSGCAQLRDMRAMAAWRRFDISGDAMTRPTSGRYLHKNSRLAGPIKYAATARGDVRCRSDLPQAVANMDDHMFPSGLVPVESRTVQWVRAITQWVDGETPGPGQTIDLDQLVDYLTQCGRSASRDGDRVLIHFHLPGAFGQIRFEHDPRVGPRLAAELLTLTGRRGPFYRAAVRLASEANWRLPLVRFALGATQPSVLSCEVCFGNALIPSAWLLVALETIETAMFLTLRELQALRDPTLARLLVAVSTA